MLDAQYPMHFGKSPLWNGGFEDGILFYSSPLTLSFKSSLGVHQLSREARTSVFCFMPKDAKQQLKEIGAVACELPTFMLLQDA